MYNVRVKKFFDTEQIQVYSCVVASTKEEEKFCRETGEIKKKKRRERGEIMFNPFTGEYERMVEWNEEEEKAKAERSSSISHARTIHKIYDVARSNNWEWFLSLTFNPDKVNRQSYEDCSKKLSQWLKNAKKIAPNMKYLVVPELHEDGVSWHFHGLFSNIDELDLQFSGHYYNGRPCYDVGKYKLGWVTAIQVDNTAKASSYITKYVNKKLCGLTKGKKRYWTSRNVDLPEVVDLMVENSIFFKRYFAEEANFLKTVNSEFLDVTYIEVKKGATDFLTFGD